MPKPRWRHGLLVVGVALLVWTVVHYARRRGKVDLGAQELAWVSLWRVPGRADMHPQGSPSSFLCYSTRVAKPHQLLLGPAAVVGSGPPVYAIDADAGFGGSIASLSTWSALPESAPGTFIRGGLEKPAVARFKGMRFRGAGEELFTGMMSPSERWIAVISFTRDDPNDLPTGPSWLGHDAPSAGTLYLDVFSTQDVRKIAAGHAHFSGGVPWRYLDCARWSDDEYFSVPTNQSMHDFFIAHLPIQ